MQTAKSNLQSEKTNLLIQIEDLEANQTSFSKTKSQLQSQVDSLKRELDDELKAKRKLASRLADAEDELARR